MKQYNPYAASHAERLKEFEALRAEKLEALRTVDWYRAYDPEHGARSLTRYEAELAAATAKAQALRTDRSRQQAHIAELVQAAKLGLDPRRWFSGERRTAARDLAAANEALQRSKDPLAHAEAELSQLEVTFDNTRDALERYRAMDVTRLEARAGHIDATLKALEGDLGRLAAKKSEVDALLKAPLEELDALSLRRMELQTDIRRAERFEKDLKAAATPAQRAVLHKACAAAMKGESSPGRVIQSKGRELQSVQRNLEKVQARLDRLAAQASRDIKTVVIDGNNLCYEAQQFVGLDLVLALAYALEPRYQVIVVFDAGIRGMTRMSNQQIAHGVPRRAKIHVVATAQEADETILEAAADPSAYVISNDRFRDFTDKAAVAEQRLIRHEIVAGKIHVHDLQVSLSYVQEPPNASGGLAAANG